MAQAMERLLATPKMIPVFPSRSIRASYCRPCDMPGHFFIHPAGHHQEQHPVVGSQRVEGVAERRRLVVLDEEVRVPRERVADEWYGDEDPQVDCEGDAEQDHGEDGSDRMQQA